MTVERCISDAQENKLMSPCLKTINLITLGFFFVIILRHTEWWSIQNEDSADTYSPHNDFSFKSVKS